MKLYYCVLCVRAPVGVCPCVSVCRGQGLIPSIFLEVLSLPLILELPRWLDWLVSISRDLPLSASPSGSVIVLLL